MAFPCTALMVRRHHAPTTVSTGCGDQDFQPLGMNIWVRLPDKLPRPGKLLAEREGKLEWIEKEENDG